MIASNDDLWNDSRSTDLNILGLEEIQEWTKESLMEKPFCTAKGKIWTETPSSIPIDKIYTKLKWVTKSRETYGVQTEELSDITELLSGQQAEGNRSFRILVQGEHVSLVKKWSAITAKM